MECQANLMQPLKRVQRVEVRTMGSSKPVKVDGPDGSLAWTVAFAACLINFIMAGLGRMSGILYVAFIEMFGISRGQAMAPFSVRSSTRNLLGPVVGILGQEYGVRAVSVMGGVIGTLSSASCFFAHDINWITLLWGGINGIGTALTTTLPQVTVGQYFKKYHTTAAGLAFSGGCVGAFLFPVLIEYLLHNYGLRGTFLIMAGITMHVIPAAMILKKPPWMKNGKKSSISSEKNSNIVDGNDKSNGIIRENGVAKTNGVVKTNGIAKTISLVEENGIAKENYVIVENTLNARNIENDVPSDLPVNAENVSFLGHETLFFETLWEAIKFSYTNTNLFFKAFNQSDELNSMPSEAQTLDFLFKLYNCPENHNTISEEDEKQTESFSEVHHFKNIEDIIGRVLCEFKNEQIMEHFLLCRQNSNSDFIRAQTPERIQCVLSSISEAIERRKVEAESCLIAVNVDETSPNDVDTIKFNQTKSSGFMEHIKTAIKLNSNPIFHLICFCRTIHFITFIPVVTVVVDFGMDKGLPEEDGKYIIAALSAGDLVGRLGLGWVTDKGYIGLPRYMLLGMVIQGATTAALPWTNVRWAILCNIAFFGMLQGSLFIRHPVLVSKYMGDHEQPIAMGCINFLSGLVGFGLPAYIGYFRDTLGSYDHMFHITGALGTFVGLLWLFEPHCVHWISNQRRVDLTQER